MRKRLALIGSAGMLAAAVRELAGDGWELVPLDLPAFDIADAQQVASVLGALAPAVIVNCAAYTNVDGAEADEERATLVNGVGPGNLARAARAVGATLVHISTDYVFDGVQDTPYREDERPAPTSAYGRSKLAGEQAIQGSGLENYYIIRTGWLYGPHGKNFVETIIRLAGEREELRVVADQVGTPTYTRDLAEAIFRLLTAVPHAPYGIYHVSNVGQCSWYEFAVEVLAQVRQRGARLKARRVVPIATGDYPLPAARPAYSVLAKDRYLAATGAALPDWQAALQCYLAERNDT